MRTNDVAEPSGELAAKLERAIRAAAAHWPASEVGAVEKVIGLLRALALSAPPNPSDHNWQLPEYPLDSALDGTTMLVCLRCWRSRRADEPDDKACPGRPAPPSPGALVCSRCGKETT